MGRPSQLTTETLTRLAYGDGTEIEMLIFCESIEGPEARFTNLVEMEGHVTHLDHYIAGQSCGAEPDGHKRADQRSHNKNSPHRQKNTRAIALLAMLGLWSWPPPPAAPAPAAVAAAAAPEPSLACSSSSPASSNDPLRNRTRQAFLGRNSWTVGFREGEARFTRNNGVLPIYPGVLFRWGGVKDSQVGEDEDKMAFLVF